MLQKTVFTIPVLFFAANSALAEPMIFHRQSFEDHTVVSMALGSSSALVQQEYDFGVTIKLMESTDTGILLFNDASQHKAKVKCRDNPGKVLVGGIEYEISSEVSTAIQRNWRDDLWSIVCRPIPVS